MKSATQSRHSSDRSFQQIQQDALDNVFQAANDNLKYSEPQNEEQLEAAAVTALQAVKTIRSIQASKNPSDVFRLLTKFYSPERAYPMIFELLNKEMSEDLKVNNRMLAPYGLQMRQTTLDGNRRNNRKKSS